MALKLVAAALPHSRHRIFYCVDDATATPLTILATTPSADLNMTLHQFTTGEPDIVNIAPPVSCRGL